VLQQDVSEDLAASVFSVTHSGSLESKFPEL